LSRYGAKMYSSSTCNEWKYSRGVLRFIVVGIPLQLHSYVSHDIEIVLFQKEKRPSLKQRLVVCSLTNQRADNNDVGACFYGLLAYM
jgi:hypothetical protein